MSVHPDLLHCACHRANSRVALSIAVTVSLVGFAVHTKHITQIAIMTLVMKLKWTSTGCLELNNKETYSNLRWPWGARKAS